MNRRPINDGNCFAARGRGKNSVATLSNTGLGCLVRAMTLDAGQRNYGSASTGGTDWNFFPGWGEMLCVEIMQCIGQRSIIEFNFLPVRRHRKFVRVNKILLDPVLFDAPCDARTREIAKIRYLTPGLMENSRGHGISVACFHTYVYLARDWRSSGWQIVCMRARGPCYNDRTNLVRRREVA